MEEPYSSEEFWPLFKVTKPGADGTQAGGAGGLSLDRAKFAKKVNLDGTYAIEIDTEELGPGRYNIWAISGEGRAVLIPIELN